MKCFEVFLLLATLEKYDKLDVAFLEVLTSSDVTWKGMC